MDAVALYRAHARYVAGFLTRMGVQAADLEDLVQEVFVVAHRRGGYAEGPATPTTWLSEIALRVVSTYRRTRQRRPAGVPLDGAAADTAAQATLPDEQADARQAMARVMRCLDTLDDVHRAVFVLFELEGQSCAAIATAMGVPTGTVHSRLSVARERFMAAWAAAEKGA